MQKCKSLVNLKTHSDENPLIENPFVYKRKHIYIHQKCAMFSPDVIFINNDYINLVKEVDRGLKTFCEKCGEIGATLGCGITMCNLY